MRNDNMKDSMIELMERPMAKRRDMGYEDKMFTILTERQAHAIDMKQLRALVELPERVFLNAFARLIEKKLVFRWRTESYREMLVLFEHANDAYYFEKIVTRCSFFEEPKEITVIRSAPFINLIDFDEETDIAILGRNRYRLAD